MLQFELNDFPDLMSKWTLVQSVQPRNIHVNAKRDEEYGIGDVIQCSAVGASPLHFTWLINTTLQYTAMFPGSQLNLTTEMIGPAQFTCTATNAYGTVKTSVNATITGDNLWYFWTHTKETLWVVWHCLLNSPILTFSYWRERNNPSATRIEENISKMLSSAPKTSSNRNSITQPLWQKSVPRQHGSTLLAPFLSLTGGTLLWFYWKYRRTPNIVSQLGHWSPKWGNFELRDIFFLFSKHTHFLWIHNLLCIIHKL